MAAALAVFSAQAAEGSVCWAALTLLLAVGVDVGTARPTCLMPARGVLCPLDLVPPSLLSTWVAAAHAAGSLWNSHGPDHGPRCLPIPVWDLLMPAHLLPLLSPAPKL